MEILEVEVEFLTDEVEEIEVDVNELDDEMTVLEEAVFGKCLLSIAVIYRLFDLVFSYCDGNGKNKIRKY